MLNSTQLQFRTAPPTAAILHARFAPFRWTSFLDDVRAVQPVL